MSFALVLAPLCFAVLAAACPWGRVRPWIVTAAAVAQLVLVALALGAERVAATGWLALDPLGKVVLALVSVVFAACGAYLPGYLAAHRRVDSRLFCACLLIVLAALSLVSQAQHLGLLWVALEAGTLAAGPLIYFHKSSRSLEAVWKYLLIGSVGIALALLGSFFLGYAALHSGGEVSLLFTDLMRAAPGMSRSWLRAAFVVMLVGYGTKMGLAPMHTWKPDAYGEAPGVVGTLLAGGLTSGAFLAVLRVYRICAAAGEAEFVKKPLVALGLLSMLVAGIFMARQKDYKRMLAYSSVEHMGILALGVGIGQVATFGAMLHLVNNGLAKGVLFLSAANIHRSFGSKSVEDVRGALARVPISAGLLLCGFFAITGSPPFGLFLSELTIVEGALTSGQWLVGAAFLLLLAIVFIGMGATMIRVVQGEASAPQPGAPPVGRERLLTIAPAVVLLALVLLLGVHVPAPVTALLREAAASLEGP